MAEYYLVSQLPSLDGLGENTPLPITYERFEELCRRYLGKKALSELAKLTLIPPREAQRSASALVARWNEEERSLRFALAKLRAEKAGKPFDDGQKSYGATLLQAARAAMEAESPLKAEELLNRYRLSFLESIRPTDTFSEEYVFYYALKLKIIARIRNFDTESGVICYKKIYNSVLHTDRSEVTQ